MLTAMGYALPHRSVRLHDADWALAAAWASYFAHTTGENQHRSTALRHLMRDNPPQGLDPFSLRVRNAIKAAEAADAEIS
jgi:hypothetical protein